MKIFTDFEVSSQRVKILALKYLSKHTLSLRNALNLQKFHPRIRKSGSAAKIFTLENLGYTVTIIINQRKLRE